MDTLKPRAEFVKPIKAEKLQRIRLSAEERAPNPIICVGPSSCLSCCRSARTCLLEHVAEQWIFDAGRTAWLDNVYILRSDDARNILLGSPVPVGEAHIVSSSHVTVAIQAGKATGDAESFFVKGLFKQGEVWPMPGAKEHASMGAIFRVRVNDCALGILPGGKGPSVDAANLEEALIVILRPVVECFQREDEHIEYVRIVLLQDGDWAPVNHLIWDSNDWRIA